MAELENIATSSVSESSPISDSELVTLFRSHSESAWPIFIERYANYIFSVLRSCGFDYDQAMDRFVYVCEKLSENDCHRLKNVRYAGSFGELKPWLRQVINRLSINWAWSESGRKRLLKPIQKMAKHEQRVFELYFWQGLSPVAIEERLQLEHFQDINLTSVFAALDRIHAELSEKKIWRLVRNLLRAQRMVVLEDIEAEGGATLESAEMGPNPEELFVREEQAQQIRNALAGLSTREALMIQLRYDDAASVAEIAAIVKLTVSEVRKDLQLALTKLRRRMV